MYILLSRTLELTTGYLKVRHYRYHPERVMPVKMWRSQLELKESVMRRLAILMLIGVCWLCGACGSDSLPLDQDPVFTYSFEDGLSGWIPKAYDITVGGHDVDWSIDTSTDRATAGVHSAKFYVDNMTDAAKILLEHEYSLAPGTYAFSLDLDFASKDYGDMNPWSYIAGVSKTAVQGPGDLHYAGEIIPGGDTDTGFVWLDKTFSAAELETGSVTVAAGEKVYVQFGVWGSWETKKTYYIDNLTVKFTKK